MTTPAAPFTINGTCFHDPYSQGVATLEDAIICAATAIGWNLWHPKEVRDRDDTVVMGEDELWERARALHL